MFEIERVQGWPMPVQDEFNRPHYAAMAEGRLCVQYCPRCQTWLAPGACACEACGAPEIVWREAGGAGEVYSYVVYHRAFDAAFAALVPYNVCLIELDEGPRVLARVVGIENERLAIGLRVRATYTPVGEGLPMLSFAPAT